MVSDTTTQQVGMGLMFYPRGGSAQVVRYLSRALEHEGWHVQLATGSLGPPGAQTNASTFFEGLSVAKADYTPALERFERGEDQLAGPVPFHGSFEDRAGAPDPVFAALDPMQTETQIEAWEHVFDEADLGRSDVIHLHHLTPMHDAVVRAFPDRPLVTHLHGTDLKMIDRIERLDDASRRLGMDLAGLAQVAADGVLPSLDVLPEAERELINSTRIGQYRYGIAWVERMRTDAARAKRIICISPHDASETVRLLGVSGDIIDVLSNGVDTELFAPSDVTVDRRRALLHHWLVDHPLGWDEGGGPGGISYPPDALDAFFSANGEPLPVLMFVGRFLGFKRVPLLIRAYALARPRLRVPAPLFVWGGSPGEWVGEHPHTVALQEGVEGVFFSGWRGHEELPQGLSIADVFVAPSVNEPFGQVFLEAMSTGLPVITTSTGGPLSFVNTISGAPNGWLVEPDDEVSLADAIVEAVNDEEERRLRAENAQEQIRGNYSWLALATRFISVYEAAIAAG